MIPLFILIDTNDLCHTAVTLIPATLLKESDS